MSHLIRYEYRAIKDTRRIQKQHFKEQHQVRTCPIMLDLFQPFEIGVQEQIPRLNRKDFGRFGAVLF